MTGAIFTKFGRAPTTWTKRAVLSRNRPGEDRSTACRAADGRCEGMIVIGEDGRGAPLNRAYAGGHGREGGEAGPSSRFPPQKWWSWRSGRPAARARRA